MAIEKGIEIKRARKDVTSVPTRKGKAPNVSVAAFHVFDTKKAGPNSRMAGTAWIKSVPSIPRRRRTMNPPLIARTLVNVLSDWSM